MEIFFGVLSLLALVFCILIIVDRTLFIKKVKSIRTGWTGQDIQNETGLKLKITNIVNKGTASYEAKVFSLLTLFSYTLIFNNGRLIGKIRN